jgi:hypothetical protein
MIKAHCHDSIVADKRDTEYSASNLSEAQTNQILYDKKEPSQFSIPLLIFGRLPIVRIFSYLY